jgi:hypothetical protein
MLSVCGCFHPGAQNSWVLRSADRTALYDSFEEAATGHFSRRAAEPRELFRIGSAARIDLYARTHTSPPLSPGRPRSSTST